jgi:hypothetical protein
VTLSISPTRSGLTTTIVCRGCKDPEALLAEAAVWIDTNDDVYFAGNSVDELRAFMRAHVHSDLCAVCFGPLPARRVGAGRPRVTCSDRCREAAYRARRRQLVNA